MHKRPPVSKFTLIYFQHEVDEDEDVPEQPRKSNNHPGKKSLSETQKPIPTKNGSTKKVDNLLGEIDREFPTPSVPSTLSSAGGEGGIEEVDEGVAASPEEDLEAQPMSSFIDFGDDDEDVDLEEMRRRQDEEFDFTGMLKQSKASAGAGAQTAICPVDLLGDLLNESDSEKRDMAFLDEILGGGSGRSGGGVGRGESNQGDLSQEWTAVFGSDIGGTTLIPFGENEEDSSRSNFMPSSLLETSLGGGTGSLMLQPLALSSGPPSGVGTLDKTSKPAQTSNTGPKPKKKVRQFLFFLPFISICA